MPPKPRIDENRHTFPLPRFYFRTHLQSYVHHLQDWLKNVVHTKDVHGEDLWEILRITLLKQISLERNLEVVSWEYHLSQHMDREHQSDEKHRMHK